MPAGHKYLRKEYKNGRWVYFYPHERFNSNKIVSKKHMWPAFDINGVGEHIYKDNFGNERTVYQTREAADRNWAAIKQNRSVNDNKRAHYEQFIKEQQTYADRRNKAGKRQNRSGEAVKASYKTTPISKIKSTFRRISSRLGGIKLSNIFK